MRKTANEYIVTVVEYCDHTKHEEKFKTVAVSVKQAVNNVAHRLGVHFTADRPYYETGQSLLHAAVVECEGKTTMLF